MKVPSGERIAKPTKMEEEKFIFQRFYLYFGNMWSFPRRFLKKNESSSPQKKKNIPKEYPNSPQKNKKHWIFFKKKSSPKNNYPKDLYR